MFSFLSKGLNACLRQLPTAAAQYFKRTMPAVTPPPATTTADFNRSTVIDATSNPTVSSSTVPRGLPKTASRPSGSSGSKSSSSDPNAALVNLAKARILTKRWNVMKARMEAAKEAGKIFSDRPADIRINRDLNALLRSMNILGDWEDQPDSSNTTAPTTKKRKAEDIQPIPKRASAKKVRHQEPATFTPTKRKAGASEETEGAPQQKKFRSTVQPAASNKRKAANPMMEDAGAPSAKKSRNQGSAPKSSKRKAEEQEPTTAQIPTKKSRSQDAQASMKRKTGASEWDAHSLAGKKARFQGPPVPSNKRKVDESDESGIASAKRTRFEPKDRRTASEGVVQGPQNKRKVSSHEDSSEDSDVLVSWKKVRFV